MGELHIAPYFQRWSLVAVVLFIATGLLMFTFKSTQFHMVGFLLVLCASFLSGLRWTLAQLVLQKNDLGKCQVPIDSPALLGVSDAKHVLLPF